MSPRYFIQILKLDTEYGWQILLSSCENYNLNLGV
jgi:hypothetical protein